ncbi:MAG: DegV family protein [Aquihabitans sp.]
MTVQIITDSAADLTLERAAELGVRIVPLWIRFGEEEYTDLVDLDAESFYRKMDETGVLPTTAAPAPGAFEAAIREAGADGDAVIVINLSGDLSATIASAENAARAIGDDIDVRVFDSKSITATLGMKVIAAANAAREGKSADEIIALLEDLRSRSRVFGALNTLEHLKKSGRIGGAQAMLGSALSIKPIIDISAGTVHEAAKVRTRRKALIWLRDRIYAEPHIEQLSLCSGNASDVEELLELIADRYPRDQVDLWTIGPVIGSHGGPGVIGFAWHADS